MLLLLSNKKLLNKNQVLKTHLDVSINSICIYILVFKTYILINYLKTQKLIL
jgi:hypothetical protein